MHFDFTVDLTEFRAEGVNRVHRREIRDLHSSSFSSAPVSVKEAAHLRCGSPGLSRQELLAHSEM